MIVGVCCNCGKLIDINDAPFGCNLPPVTDGPVYGCQDCYPATAEDALASIESFINPPKESI